MFEQNNCNLKITQIHTVHETTDDRGSRGKSLGSYLTRPEADKAAKGKGWYASQGAIDTRNIMIVSDQSGNETAFELKHLNPVDLSHVISEKQCLEVDSAYAQIEKMGLSKEAMQQLVERMN